jgi:hypothetical protein
MILKEEIYNRLGDFTSLCTAHDIKYLYAFFKVIHQLQTNLMTKKVIFDLLVEINDLDPLERGEKLISLWDRFESCFERKVDLLTDSSIKNPYLRKSIDSTKVLIYDGSSQKVLI